MARKKDVTQKVEAKTELSAKPESKTRAKVSKPAAEKLSVSKTGSAAKPDSTEKVRSSASAKSSPAKTSPAKTRTAGSSQTVSPDSNYNGGGDLKREKLSDYESAFRPVTVDLIAERAWLIWQEEGCPEGRDLQHWLRAEQELSSST